MFYYRKNIGQHPDMRFLCVVFFFFLIFTLEAQIFTVIYIFNVNGAFQFRTSSKGFALRSSSASRTVRRDVWGMEKRRRKMRAATPLQVPLC